MTFPIGLPWVEKMGFKETTSDDGNTDHKEGRLKAVFINVTMRKATLLVWWTLIIAYVRFLWAAPFSDILPPFLTFWSRPSKMVNFNALKSESEAQKKDIPRIHIGMDFLQKTGSKLVIFCLSGPIYIFPPPIGGRHPVPCLGTPISERDMVQQCTRGGIILLLVVFFYE